MSYICCEYRQIALSELLIIENMNNYKNTAKKIYLAFIVLFALNFSVNTYAQDGKALFQTHCAACHTVHKDMTGPALAGTEDRWADKDLLHQWILNSSKVVASGDAYANEMFNKWNKIPMTHFEGILSNEDIDAILAFIKEEEAKPAAGAGAATTAVAAPEPETNHTLLYGVITILLAIVGFVLLLLNKKLKVIADYKEGDPAYNIPFYRKKSFIALASIVLFILGGFWVVQGAINLGQKDNYQPEQPIFFSHRVHAGINQINCMFCHTNTQDGKTAMVPSVNVCMNCHMAITEYTGEQLYKPNGDTVNGTQEIQKLYEYAGYTPGQPWDETKARHIPWVRIHQLPDHVYFNHAQHTMVGNVQCQTCHGEINAMDEVKQFATLNMGWCINCHRTTDVNFKGNAYYSMYEKYHQQLKNGEIDSTKGVTVEMIGGLECQKCHY